jgi:hypothetical protein
MLKTSEILIKQVFDEVVKSQPELEIYAIATENRPVNFRMLGNQLIENFPWPIGVELRRLFSISQLGFDLLTQIFKTVERTLQFVSFVMISQVVEEKMKNNLEIPENFRTSFQPRFQVLNLGDYIWLIKSLGNMMKKQNVPWFMTEIPANLNERFHEDVDFCVQQRNESAHFQTNPSKADVEMKCVKMAENLTHILTRVAFLVKYKLVYVKEIKVIKSKNQDAHFHHNLDLLHSTHSDFSEEELDERRYTESNSVLLMKSSKSIGEYLNLSPLIIDTSSEIIDEEKRFSIKKDIYLYSKFRNENIVYNGTETTEVCDLRSLHNYSILMEELKEIINTLS